MDRRTDILTYAGAATPSPLVFPPDEDEPLVGSGVGFPIGMFGNSTSETHELHFPNGSSLLLYSDAVTEGVLETGGRLEERGLIGIASECLRGAPRENLVKDLTKRLDELLDQPLADDLTVVCTTRSEGVGAG